MADTVENNSGVGKMRDENSLGALIVSAGHSSRINRFDPLQMIGRTTVIARIIATMQQAGADPVVVVTGLNAEQVEDALKNLDVVCLRNDNYAETDMFDSAKIGLSWLKHQSERILFTPVSVPLFTVETVRKLLCSQAEVAVPSLKGRAGHPILLRRSTFDRLIADEGGGGMRKAIARLSLPIDYVDTSDPGIKLDEDEPDAYATLLEAHNRQLLRPQVSLTLARENPFFDRAAARLLGLIEQTGSVVTACRRMKISYSKGWQILNKMEKELKMTVVERRPGGKDGGSSSLTPQGRRLLERFLLLEEKAAAAVLDVFDDVFGDE